MAKRKLSTFERLRRGEKLRRSERNQLERQFQAEKPGWEVVHRDVAGIDVGGGSHFVAVDPQRTQQPVREFGSWTADLRKMVEWLRSCGVQRVVMQTTGVYWIALQDVLEEAGFEVAVVDARGTKSLPGRKSDVQECQWIRKLDLYGLLRECFQAPSSIRAIRSIWRSRDRLVTDAGQSIQRMQKVLTTMNVQLANTISDIAGVTGIAILRAILAGERDPWKLAKLRDGRIEASEEEIALSLEGNWREELLFELQQVMDCYDFQQKQLAECDQKLKQYLSAQPTRQRDTASVPETKGLPTKKRRGRKPKGSRAKPKKNQPDFDLESELRRVMGVDLTRIDGINLITTQIIYSEIGPDFSAFPTEGHFASWLGLTPKKDISGGKVIKQRSTHVSNRVANALRMSAQSLSRSNSYLGARYRSLRGRLDGVIAVKAMARYLACLVHRMVTKGEAYVDRGAAYFEKKRHDRTLLLLRQKAAAVGMQLVPVI